MTDPIADYLTRLRNAVKAGHRVVEIPASNLKKEITKILFDKGYILNFKFVEDGPQGSIKVALKYDRSGRVNALQVFVSMSAIVRCPAYSMVSVSLSSLLRRVS